MDNIQVGDWVQLVSMDDRDLNGSTGRLNEVYQVSELGPVMGRPYSFIRCKDLISVFSNGTGEPGIYVHCFRKLDPFQLKVFQARNQLLTNVQ